MQTLSTLSPLFYLDGPGRGGRSVLGGILSADCWLSGLKAEELRRGAARTAVGLLRSGGFPRGPAGSGWDTEMELATLGERGRGGP